MLTNAHELYHPVPVQLANHAASEAARQSILLVPGAGASAGRQPALRMHAVTVVANSSLDLAGGTYKLATKTSTYSAAPSAGSLLHVRRPSEHLTSMPFVGVVCNALQMG
jgi:hypothetical protein